VEETMHVKFDDKQPDKVSELVEEISDLQVSDDEASEPISFSDPLEVSAPTNSENINDEVTSDAEIDTESEEDAPPKNTF
ncbi:hypothetical protein A2U01_0092957, partial [Trifolium medium]|nr:hypothetical protein [Trifolium medium]